MKSKLYKKVTAIALTVAMSLSVFGAFGSAVFAEQYDSDGNPILNSEMTNQVGLDLVTTGENADVYPDKVENIEQPYNVTTDENTIFLDENKNEISSLSCVKVEWNIKPVNIQKTNQKIWDPSTFSWSDNVTTEVVFDGADFTLTNYSTEDVDATISFAPEVVGTTDIKDFRLLKDNQNVAEDNALRGTCRLAASEGLTQEEPVEMKVKFDINQEVAKNLNDIQDGKFGSYTVRLSEIEEEITPIPLCVSSDNVDISINFDGTDVQYPQSAWGVVVGNIKHGDRITQPETGSNEMNIEIISTDGSTKTMKLSIGDGYQFSSFDVRGKSQLQDDHYLVEDDATKITIRVEIVELS